ncbi:TonB-dependent receptor [Leptospira interrogans]|uniref:TonB-dependent receptor n=1 Tax=Leptospira interrogans TaxID=173 RepID=UPI00034666A1|nr:TonB-dependent siderophore receptor [Leptospira interrogans]QCO32743.1 TonB-dependent siderophore receptor [Leptospira interrogans]UMQ53074.1 TonB-dependent siderophore receptor [Leptospira interrogans]
MEKTKPFIVFSLLKNNIIFYFFLSFLSLETFFFPVRVFSQEHSKQFKKESSETKDLKTEELNKDEKQSEGIFVKGYTGKGLTGMKQNVRLKDISATVNIIDYKELKARAADQWLSAISYVPGIFVIQNYGGFNTLTIRGLDSRNTLLLKDGARDDTFLIQNSSPMSNLTNVERIEILKGPNSVLYGQGAMAGVIHIITKKPQKKAGYEFSFTKGNFGSKRAYVGATGPIGTESLRYRIDAATSEYQGFRKNSYNLNNISTSFEWDISVKHTLSILSGKNFDFIKPDAGLPKSKKPNIDLIAPGVYLNNNYNTKEDYLKNESGNFKIQLDSKFSNKLSMKSFISYLPQTYYYFSAEDLTISSRDENTIERDHFHFETKRSPLQGTVELQCIFQTGFKHKLLSGYEYHWMISRHRQRYFPIGSTNINVLYPQIDLTQSLPVNFKDRKILYQQMHSLYFQDLMELSKIIKFVLGGRYDSWVRENVTEKLSDWNDRYVSKPEDRTIHRFDAKVFTYRLGLVYQPLHYYTAYVGYSTAFIPVTFINIKGDQLKPEMGEQIELGQRLEFAKGKIQLTSALFAAKKYDVAVRINSKPALYNQAGELRTNGYEFDIDLRLTQRWSLKSGYAHTIAEWESFRFVNSKGNEIDYKGNRPINVPRNTANLWTTYTFASGLGFGLGGRYIDSIAGDNANSFSIPPYGLYDASLYYQYKHFRFQINCNNISNKKYFISSTPNPTPGTPRQFLFTASAKF